MKTVRITFRYAFLSAGLVILTACSEGDTEKKPPPPVPVIAVKATEQDIPVGLRVVGRAEAFASVVLKSRIDGQVAEVLFTEGQHVKQGDILIRLDPSDFSARLRQAKRPVVEADSNAMKPTVSNSLEM